MKGPQKRTLFRSGSFSLLPLGFPAMAIRKRVFEILEVADSGDRTSKICDFAIMGLILLNVAALVLESVPEYGERFGPYFSGFELISLSIFTVEYLMRVWACVEDSAYSSPITGRLRYAVSFQALVDLLAVLPFYIDLGVDTRFVRVLRLLKLARYIDAMQMFHRVLVKKRVDLMVTLIVIGILLIFTSCVMYIVERGANPDFSSIPEAMWWSIVTLTTVGYGDTRPITPLGQFLAGFVAILGIGMFALPTSILGAAFLVEMGKRGKSPTCPHCGEEI